MNVDAAAAQATAPAPAGEAFAWPEAEFNEARCKALMRVLISIVWVADPEGRFIAPQRSWSAYTGQTWEEQQGHGWFRAVHADDRDELRNCLEKARREGVLYRATGRLWHAPTQTWRHVDVRGVPIRGDDGEVVEWVGTCRDVDEKIRAEQVLRDADRRKDEFIAVLAHELRNPLAPIRNAVQVLKLRGSADMQLGWASSIIERQVEQMAHLLDDLLDVSRISQNKMELQRRRVTLDAVLDAAIEASRPHWEQLGHRFELNVLAAPIYVDADPSRLTQAFVNLLNNAAKYTNRGGRITLTVRRDGPHAVVEVEDTGIGISGEMLPHLFEIFTQETPALGRSQGGLGIGLSIVKALVTMHGGTVEARSPGGGQGSTFIVRLPVASRAADAAPPSPGRGGTAPERLKVLVADDNQDAADSLALLLNLQGHDVRVAGDGQEALDVARDFRPDVALLDIGMPKLNGYDVARELARASPRPLLVAVTGWGQQEDQRRAAEAGFDRHLVKPAKIEDITRLLDERAAAAH